MQSAKNKKEFEPQSVAVANLYVENQRLQRKCYAYKRQIRGMQRTLQAYKLLWENAMLKKELKAARTASPAPTTTEVENAVST